MSSECEWASGLRISFSTSVRESVRKSGGQATLRGPHLLLQTRTKVHNEDLDDVFRRWYPKFWLEPQTQEPERKVA